MLVGLWRGMMAEIPDKSAKRPTVWQQVTQERIQSVVGAPESSIAAGLISGDRSAIPKKITQNFRDSGLSHLLAVSGYNVTLVANMVIVVIKGRVPIKLQVAITIIVIGTFAVFAGADSAVVRAAIMGGIASLVMAQGRSSTSYRAILVAASVMTLIQPSLVIYDVGFQLSFLATLAIIYLSPKLAELTSKIPDVLGIRTSLITTVAAVVGTLPVVIIVFGRISLVGLLANILVAPLIPLAMAGATLAAILSRTLLGPIVGYIESIIVSWIIKTAEHMAALPHALVEVESLWLAISITIGVWSFLLILYVLYVRTQRRKKQKLLLE